MIHDLDTLHETVDSGTCVLNFSEIPVHLFEVLLYELIYDLGRQINPNVKNTVFALVVPKSILQVLLNSLDHFMGMLKVVNMPLIVRLVLKCSLFV